MNTRQETGPQPATATLAAIINMRQQPVLLVFAVAAFLLPLLAMFAPLGLAPLGGFVGVLLLLLALRGQAPFPKIRTPLVILLLALLSWAALSTFWAIDPGRSLRTIVRLAPIFVAAAFILGAAATVDQRGQHAVAMALVGSFVIVLVLLLIELFAGAPLSRLMDGPRASGDYLAVYNRSASVLSLIVWPVLLASHRHLGRLATIAILVATIFVVDRLNSTAPLLGVVFALPVFLAASVWRRASALFLAAILLILTLGAPATPLLTPLFDRALAGANVIDAGINHRLAIWEYVAGRSQQRPLIGWGLDASRNLAGDNDRVTIRTNVEGATTAAEVVPLHPHNAPLQIWVELGLPGAILAALLFMWTIRCVLTGIPGKTEAAICLAVITSATVSAELSFGIWQGWWQATLWLTAALTLALAHPLRPATP